MSGVLASQTPELSLTIKQYENMRSRSLAQVTRASLGCGEKIQVKPVVSVAKHTQGQAAVTIVTTLDAAAEKALRGRESSQHEE